MSFKVLTSIKSVDNFLLEHRNNKKISLIHTMGNIHEGHIALIKRAIKETDIVIVSIFINIIQFDKTEDINNYPENLNKDKKILKELGVHALFAPKLDTIYPQNYSSYIIVDGLSDVLCGITKPLQCNGFTTLMCKLFNIIKPHYLYLGEKDYQQLIIIKKMIDDLEFNITVKSVQTVREKSGLALSTRNSFLSPREIIDANLLYKALKHAKDLFKKGEYSTNKLINAIENTLHEGVTLQVDYIAIVDSDTLNKLMTATKGSHIIIACYCGSTRLIDNISLKG